MVIREWQQLTMMNNGFGCKDHPLGGVLDGSRREVGDRANMPACRSAVWQRMFEVKGANEQPWQIRLEIIRHYGR